MASSMTSYNPVESYSPHHGHPSASSYVTNSPLSAALANAKSAEYQTYYPYATSQRSKSFIIRVFYKIRRISTTLVDLSFN